MGNGRGLHTSPFLTLIDAHFNALRICVRYLSSEFLQLNDIERMREYFHKGDYGLLLYCQSYWLRHLVEYLQLGPKEESVHVIAEALATFLRARKKDITQSNDCLPFLPPTE